jgi:hypothetical protein
MVFYWDSEREFLKEWLKEPATENDQTVLK